MKVSDLAGDYLDHWVARAQGWVKWYDPKTSIWWWRTPLPDSQLGGLTHQCDAYHPSEDWLCGGPLLVAQEIFVVTNRFEPSEDMEVTEFIAGQGVAHLSPRLPTVPLSIEGEMRGRTYLEAGMRTFVFANFGSNVENHPNWENPPTFDGDPENVATAHL